MIPKTETVETLDGIRERKELCPDGWVVMRTYCPSSCPWDYYGNKFLAECKAALREHGIEGLALRTRRDVLNPRGSGPNGQVRFGDEMTPGIYRIAVKDEDHSKARDVLNRHETEKAAWLKGEGEMPKAMRR